VLKGRLCQLLKEFLINLSKKNRDLVFILLLLKAGIVEENKLGCLG
jgi:hypothetical protein